MHRENIGKIITEGNVGQMWELKDVLVCMIDDMKVLDKQKYKEYELCIHKILYGAHLGKDLADHWVSKMKNKDGTIGAHWTHEQVDKVVKDKDLKGDANDWYAILNMVYSDHYKAKFDITDYVDLAKDWIYDSDVGSCKLLKYYFFVVLD